MDSSKVLAAFDLERQALPVRGFQRIAAPGLVRHVPASPSAAADAALQPGLVSYSAHSPSEVEAAIDHVIAAFAELGCGFEWKVFEHDAPRDLVARLSRRGLGVGDEEQLMILPVADAGAQLGQRPAHRVERVTTPAGIADYLAVSAAVWTEEPGYVGWLQQELRDNGDEVSLYVAYYQDEPAAAARASFQRGSSFAGLWAGATLPAYRGKGLYTALVHARAREASERGFAYLMVDALDTSRTTLARFGFQRLSASRPCRWSPRELTPGG